ncbi:hypothetical protein SPFL3102_01709 [Sporomusaceae bacterium FL31]|nr:hypothetical protein SPFL3101_03343 [Sporomusaceae bacterium FL31]GCE33900.1 hypothetical protein SPFL3102_01709 [Sporomusaceae bacterium]
MVAMKENKIIVWSYKYTVDISPTIKGIISYLTDKNMMDTFITDRLYSSSFRFSEIINIEIIPQWLDSIFNFFKGFFRSTPKSNIFIRALRKLMAKIEYFWIVSKLKKIKKTDIVFCMEFHSLFMLYKAGFPLSQVVYFSLECEAIIEEYKKCNVQDILLQCAFCVIQSPERAQDLINDLGVKLEFEYLPVSLRPIHANSTSTRGDSEELKIIYSGYIATWSCIKEFLNAYKDIQCGSSKVVLQGHAMGSEVYFNEVSLMSNRINNLEIDSNYYNDEEHIKLLADFDMGLALYPSNEQSPNWNNLIFSSGKIATYLWAGLPIITNVKSPITKCPPFLYIDEITTNCLENAFKLYSKDKMKYKLAAKECANKFYNLDFYMDKIITMLR